MIELDKQKLHHLDIKPCNILFNYVNRYIGEGYDFIRMYNNDIDKIFENNH